MQHSPVSSLTILTIYHVHHGGLYIFLLFQLQFKNFPHCLALKPEVCYYVFSILLLEDIFITTSDKTISNSQLFVLKETE